MRFLAAAAAKIKAEIEARMAPQHSDVPPMRSASATYGSSGLPSKPIGSPTSASPDAVAMPLLNGDIYVTDGDYMKDIEINDLRIRYTLTNGQKQQTVISPYTSFAACPTDRSFGRHTCPPAHHRC